MRCTLAHKIREVEKSVCTDWNSLGFLVHKVVFINTHILCSFLFGGTEIVSEPLEGKSCALSNAHYVPGSGNSRTAGMNTSLGVNGNL